MIVFESSVSFASRLLPVRVVLKESLSECYSLVVDLFAADASFDPTEALNQKASVRLDVEETTGPKSRTITGIITEMSLAGVLPGQRYWYQLVLAPRLALLDLTRRSRVFCTEKPATVGDVIRETLDEVEGVALTSDDAEMGLRFDGYPKRDMIVQYRESDFAFLSRLAEHSGIFYFFTRSNGREKVVFADANDAFRWLGGTEAESKLPYRPSIGIPDRGPAVRSAALKTRLTTKRVQLNERAYAQPEIRLDVSADADPNGVGLLDSHELEGYRDAGWGQALARIRAEEASANRVVLEGESDCLPLSAGAVFSLDLHPSEDLNDRYIVVSAEHRAWESAEGIEHLPGQRAGGAGYWNSFTAIPRDTPFRPRRRTPWPRIPGLVRATIDGTDLIRSNIDPLGCYRIKFHFDTVTRAAGLSSCPVRLITPYGGPNEGFHFPLRAKSEVMIAFQNGDPDRPVIVGPLYDAAQKSMVTGANRTANVISTVTGIKITMNDGTAG
jgi:type VI secretion system secreted protein VgrG